MPRDNSSVWVLPIMLAPLSTNRCTTGAVRLAGACSASQSGLPAPVTWPAMSNRAFAAKVRPASCPPGAPCKRAAEWGQNAFSESYMGRPLFRRKDRQQQIAPLFPGKMQRVGSAKDAAGTVARISVQERADAGERMLHAGKLRRPTLVDIIRAAHRKRKAVARGHHDACRPNLDVEFGRR